jgi:hypothetical protein
VVWVISQVLVEVDVIYKGECDSKIGQMGEGQWAGAGKEEAKGQSSYAI